MSLFIDDLRVLAALATVAKNEARRAAEAEAGADFLQALSIGVPPSVRGAARAKLDRADELSALAARVGEELDARLVAIDPSGKLYPAAQARVRERQAAATPVIGPVPS